MVNSRQPVKFSGILLAAIVAVWLSESTRESSTTDHNEAGKFGLIQESVDEVLAQNPEIDGLSRESSDAPSEIKAVDRWEDALVLSSRRTEWSPDGNSYQLRRIVRHAAMRFPILVEEKIRASSATGLIEKREVLSERAAGHFLLTPRSHVSEDTLRNFVYDKGLQLGERISPRGPYRIILPESEMTVDSILVLVAEMNSSAYSSVVEYADYDFVRRVSTVPNDTYYNSGDQWSLDNNGSRTGSVEGVDIGALEGWTVRTDASDIIVAIVDTGVRYTHEDLKDNIWINADEIPDNDIDDDGNGYVDDMHGINALYSSQLSVGGDPVDEHGHGTHVAGTVGARGNNGVGVTGIAWNVQLMPLKFLGPNGNGMDSDAIKCIDYAIDNGADIINNSWGGDGVNRALTDAVERANEAGVIVVVAAGNGGDNIDIDAYTPAGIDLPNVVTVANHDDAGDLRLSSNYGPVKVDIAAPGTRIRSSTHRTDSSYGYKSGTSMAAPHVSGALALLKAEYPEESYIKLIERVLQGAVTVGRYDEKIRTAARLSLANSMAVTEFVPSSPSRSTLSSRDGYVSLSWEYDWIESTNGFRIEKRINDGEWKIVGFGDSQTRRFEDPVQLFSASTVYRVFSVNENGYSLPSQNQVLNLVVEGDPIVEIQLPMGDEGIGFGTDIDSNSDTLVVGAPFDEDSGDESGSVYIYERLRGSGWQYRQKLIGTDSDAYDNFGYSVGLSGSTLVVGAYNEDGGSTDEGAVYLFEQGENGVWVQTRKLKSPIGKTQDRFGFSVDVHRNVLVSSARDDDDSGRNAGAVHIFERDSGTVWTHRAKLTPPSGSGGEYFGWSVSVHGDRILVGAKGDDSRGTGAGSVYVYRKSGNVWQLEQKILPDDLSSYDAFGTSVDFDGASIVVGTPNDDSEVFDSGSVSLYRHSGARWERERIFTPFDPEGSERVGFDAAVFGNRIAATGQAEDGLATQGLIYEKIAPEEWQEASELLKVAISTIKGVSVSLSDEVVTFGNPSERKLRSFYDMPESLFELNIAGISEDGVSLSWTGSGVDAKSIVIERRELGEASWGIVTTKGSGVSSFVDGSSMGGRQWEYRIRAVSGGVSSPSNSVTSDLLPMGRLVNLSVRGYVGDGERVLIPGFTVIGSEELSLAIRARGPSLSELEVPNAILDPQLTVYPLGQDSIGWNDNWGESFSISEMELFEFETGASPIEEFDSESVFLGELETGVYTVIVEKLDEGSGLGLAEIFEVPEEGQFNENTALVNLSARGFVDRGASVLIGGLVVGGDAPVRVLLRGVGPGLKELGVEAVLEEPRITLHNIEGTLIASNEKWGMGGQIGEVIDLSSQVGAFDLKLGSNDSAMVAVLPPGLYTCVLDTVTDHKGVGLLEIYLAP